jgi:hypothetical protein
MSERTHPNSEESLSSTSPSSINDTTSLQVNPKGKGKPKGVNFRSFVPQGAYKSQSSDIAWFTYESESDPDITFKCYIHYLDDRISGLVNRFTTGGRIGRKAEPGKMAEAYARFVFLNFEGITVDDAGTPMENTLENRTLILKNSDILAFIITTSQDVAGYVDMGEGEDQKKSPNGLASN